MNPKTLIQNLAVAERLKDATRHCYTSGGRHESVAEHSWRMTLMAYWVSDEFPEANLEKLFKMCLIHDLGEAFTGDIPSFEKTQALISHNESDLSTWIPLEYDLQMTYGNDKVIFSEYLTQLRDQVREDSKRKIAEEGDNRPEKKLTFEKNKKLVL